MAPDSFFTPLDVEYIDGRVWKVITPFEFNLANYEHVTVPAGFVTDFASVPKAFWNLFPPTGSYGKAAVVHDLLYQTGRIGDREIRKDEADDVFNDGMALLRTPWHVRMILYWGVRLFGGRIWQHYRDHDES